ncbi:beta-alanine transporter isoform X1 [Stomoxys calcitrans]|uniref:beta-alanine transporter isoform X1 n=2 Tax=Stomoxys calcitrans TaxID=35570 RepID=UPI0027E3A2C6|nr:beta-alanine transporter isoform X1 [Stomoxys calcitrans]
MDFDKVLMEVGSFGLYQKIIICAVLLPAALPCAFHAYSQLFIAATPKHWCRTPELEPWVQDYTELVMNLSIPIKEQNYVQCDMYVRNYSDIVRYLEYRTPLELQRDKVWHIGSPKGSRLIPCQHGWHYDRSQYPTTVVTEWNLVCDKSYLVTLALVVFGIGGLLGNYVFGYLQDMWGRRPSFYAYLLLEIVACAASAFAWNFEMWLGLRFVVGLTVPAILASPYVLAIEMVGPEKRVFCTIVSNIAYSCGLVLLAGVVYIVRDWRYLSLAVSLPLLLLFSCFFVLPESPRWLMAVNQPRKAAKILKVMARVNGIRVVPNFISLVEQRFLSAQGPNQSAVSHGILDLFRTKNMLRKTMIITLIWFANTSVYVGLSYYAPALGGDEIWNFFLAGVVELPTYIILWPGLSYCGRRSILCISMLTGGIACVTTSVYSEDPNVMLILYCIGKMGISSAFVVLPLLASEIYPTVVRGLGMSFSSVIAMIGPIVIPIINHMGQQMLVLPLIIMGSLLIGGGVLSLFLPETRGKNLPQTIEDSERIPLSFLSNCCSDSQPKSNVSRCTNSRNNCNSSHPHLLCSICKSEIITRRN